MKSLLFVMALLSACGLYAQSVPNGNFESWNTTTLNEPAGWMTSNPDALRKIGMINATKVTGQSGSAIRLETKATAKDTQGGYVINSGGDPLQGGGGVPYSQIPTGITGYYRYNFAPGDSGLMLVFFKKNGMLISFDVHTFRPTGSQSTFTAFNFPITLTTTPDSVIIGFASSNLMSGNGVPGSWLEIDGLAFTGTGITQPIPNGNFENWNTVNIDVPLSWESFGPGATKSTSAFKGSYALQLTSFDDGGGPRSSGVTTGHMTQNGPPRGGYPFSRQTDTLVGYYKFTGTAGDSASIMINLMSKGSPVGGAQKRLGPASSYTYFQLPFSSFTKPDTIMIFIESSSWPYTNTRVGNTLIIDEVQLKSQPLHTGIVMNREEFELKAFPNPAKDFLMLSAENTIQQGAVISISDLTGRTTAEYNFSSNPLKLDISQLKPGIYFYEVRNSDGAGARNKFIKE